MRRGFTLVEILMVMLVLAIAATIGLDALANTEAGLRSDRAAREAATAIKYARMLSVTTGGTYGVEFDTTNARFQVFQTTGSNVVPQPMEAGGTYVVNLSQRELAGTTMTVSLGGLTTNPYDLTYAAMGNASNSGTVVFTYAGVTKTVTIPAVGDPTIQ
jgi:prepilin-type N-terminal cleavage/methylation domain-containing protein